MYIVYDHITFRVNYDPSSKILLELAFSHGNARPSEVHTIPLKITFLHIHFVILVEPPALQHGRQGHLWAAYLDPAKGQQFLRVETD